ncbi:MAG: hypothetical protein ACK5WZ_09535, partial [Pseudobdellovibrionaceae bacterium]
MRHLKLFISILLIFMPLTFTFAQRGSARGPGEGGGGDPDAQQFVILGRKLSIYFKENPRRLSLPFRADRFLAVMNRIDHSIKDESLRDLVEFTNDRLYDQYRVAKPALYRRSDSFIRIHRPYWLSASDLDKLTLITMEISGILGVNLRYQNAGRLIDGQVPLILSMQLPHEGNTTPIDVHLAGADTDIFARLTSQDVIIDGGIVGDGSVQNQRVAKFLENPLQDREWMELSQAAFRRGFPAYLILRDKSGHRASITGFRERTQTEGRARPGVATYTLLFYGKTSVPIGSCSHESTELSGIDRLKNCFFDRRHYDLLDASSGAHFLDDKILARQNAWKESF